MCLIEEKKLNSACILIHGLMIVTRRSSLGTILVRFCSDSAPDSRTESIEIGLDDLVVCEMVI